MLEEGEEMAGVYTTKRGKNKKKKLGVRKDNKNNQANKLNTKLVNDPLAKLLAEAEANKISIGQQVQQKRQDALQAKTDLLALTTRCANPNCHKTQRTTELSICTACREISYCGAECQRADWKEHKIKCKAAQEKSKKNDEAFESMILGALNEIQAEKSNLQSNPQSSQTQPHTEDEPKVDEKNEEEPKQQQSQSQSQSGSISLGELD